MILLIASSVVSAVLVLPWQERLLELSAGDDVEAMRRALIQWSVWGMFIMIPFTLVAWLMVVQQPLLL
ncbi:MAG: hypothetical protein QF515_15225 [Pseudomonadales bacterium]|nr:hypothetical protein [Pseudomonadales bacterium]